MTSTIVRLAAALPRLTLSGLLARLVEADRAWRDTHRLERLSETHLGDMGLERRSGEIRRR